MDDEILKNSARIKEILTKLQGWPEVGDKIIFTGATDFWFTNIVKNAKKLTVGAEYQISEIQVASSWCRVKVLGFDCDFALSFFDYVKREVSEEERKTLTQEMWDLNPPLGVRQFRAKNEHI